MAKKKHDWEKDPFGFEDSKKRKQALMRLLKEFIRIHGDDFTGSDFDHVFAKAILDNHKY